MAFNPASPRFDTNADYWEEERRRRDRRTWSISAATTKVGGVTGAGRQESHAWLGAVHTAGAPPVFRGQHFAAEIGEASLLSQTR